jgi:hypothetical protein
LPWASELTAADGWSAPAGGGLVVTWRQASGRTRVRRLLALAAAALLLAANGDTQALVPLFAVGVFIGFTLSQLGMVKHWRTERTRGWKSRAVINGVGAVLTAATTVIELVSKFTQGAWLIVIVIPGLVLLFGQVYRDYAKIGALLQLGQTPKPPSKIKSLVVVPVASISRLTAAGINAALSLGDDVLAVTVCFTDPEDVAADVSFRGRWEEWHPNVPLITLHTTHRSITRPIVKYLSQIEDEDKYHRLVVLIPEVQPPRFWDYVLFNGAARSWTGRSGGARPTWCSAASAIGWSSSRPALLMPPTLTPPAGPPPPLTSAAPLMPPPRRRPSIRRHSVIVS